MIKPYLVHTHAIQCQARVTCNLSCVFPSSPNQMGSKAKPGAKGPAKAKAKAPIAKAMAGGLAEATAGGLAKAKSKAKEASSSRCTKKLGTRGGKGWASIQEGQPMGQLGAQTVKDRLERLVAQDPVKNKKLLDQSESLQGVFCQADICPPAQSGQGWQLHDCH